MDKKTTAIVVTVAAMVLCACPGFFAMFMGAMFAIVSFIPGAGIDVMGISDPQSALSLGIGILSVGVVFLLIAAAAIFFSWRRKPEAGDESASLQM